MINRRNLGFIIFLLFSVKILVANSFGLCEKGDLIFRWGAKGMGHTGIYCDWMEPDDPSDALNQNIVEAPGLDYPSGVWEVSLSDFYSDGKFWGARTKHPTIEQRRSIVEFVRSKFGCPYNFK